MVGPARRALGAAFGIANLGTPPGLPIFLAGRFKPPALEVCRAALPMMAILGVGVLIITYAAWASQLLCSLSSGPRDPASARREPGDAGFRRELPADACARLAGRVGFEPAARAVGRKALIRRYKIFLPSELVVPASATSTVLLQFVAERL